MVLYILQEQQQQQQQQQTLQQSDGSEGLQRMHGYCSAPGGSLTGMMMDSSCDGSSVTPDMVPAQRHLPRAFVSSNAGVGQSFDERLEDLQRLMEERSGGLEGVDEPADYTAFMSSAEDEQLQVMEGFSALAPHHMEGSDNDHENHENYNELEASVAEGGAEREGKGASQDRKRKIEAVSKVPRSSGEATAEAKKAKAR